MVEERILLSHGVIPGPRAQPMTVLIEAARRQRLPLSGNLSGGFSYQTNDGVNYLITVHGQGGSGNRKVGQLAIQSSFTTTVAFLTSVASTELDRTRADVSDHRPWWVIDGRWYAQHRTQIETLAIQDHGKHHRRHRSVRRGDGKPDHPGHTVLADQQRAQRQASRHGDPDFLTDGASPLTRWFRGTTGQSSVDRAWQRVANSKMWRGDGGDRLGRDPFTEQEGSRAAIHLLGDGL